MNVGGLSFTYGLETDDTIGSSYVFNAHDAAWITFARGLFPACQTMYRNRESAGCFNTANFLKKMNDYQATRPERVWVADAQRKYLRPYEDNGTETYLPMLAGRKTHQREQVKTYNAYYYASKYVSDFCTSQNIMVRGNTPTSGTTISVVPPANTARVSMYINCYIVVASTSYNVVAKTRATRGTTYTMDFTTIGSMGETELYFCSAPMITELGDLAHLYFKQNNFSMGTNLQRLEIGSGLTGYQNVNLESLTIGNSKMLEYLDVRNCPNVTGSLDLSGCVSLQEVYLENTSFTGITFAPAGLLEIAHLPSPTSITLRELMYLEDLTLASTNNLTTLRIENCSFADDCELTIGGVTTDQQTKDIILTLVDSSSNLSRIRFSGVDWALDGTTTLESLYRMAGIDDDGYDTARSVLSGAVYVPTMRQSHLDKYNTVWPYLVITYDSMVTQYLATFLNSDGTAILNVNGNAYTQWIDAGSVPYDPITMGYTITISGIGTPVQNEYAASSYSGKYYRDTSNGYIYGSDGTSWSLAAEADILTPLKAEDAQYTYTFSGWDDITTPMSYSRNVTAEYSTTERTYTVRFYRDASTLLRTVTGVPYGGCVDYADTDTIVGYGVGAPATNGYAASSYNGKYYQDMSSGAIYLSNGSTWSTTTYFSDIELPSWTTDESSYIFRVFKGWNKNTGFITSDVNVYAEWISTPGALPASGTDMSNMNVAQIYGICQAGLQDVYFEDLDHTDLTLGHDYNFSNVESITIGPKYYTSSTENTLSINSFIVDQFVSGGYYLDGSSYYATDISLFGDDSPSFTLALDFDCAGAGSGATIFSANYGSTSNLRLYYSGSNATLQWGDVSVNVAIGESREMLVLRHRQGSKVLFVYSAGYSDAAADRYSPTITKTTLTRSTTPVDEDITLGAVNYHTTSNTFRNIGKGHIHWMKVWYDDLGDVNAYNLAAWPHELMRMEYWGKGKYELADGSGNLSNASFIANCELKKGYWMNSTNTNAGGWDSSLMRTFLRNRILKALPTEWQALIKTVQINATIGSQSTTIATSADKVYLASYREVGGSGNGYNDEIGNDAAHPNIPWFVAQTSSSTVSSYNTANAQRLKWRGRLRTYALGDGNTTAYDGNPYIYYTSSNVEPATAFSTNIAPGSIWVNGGNSSIGYIFVSSDELTQYNITPAYTANSTYASGGWVSAAYWWERSPYISNSTYFMFVTTGGGPSANTNATSVSGVVCGFSI